jgi:hypothetical protein
MVAGEAVIYWLIQCLGWKIQTYFDQTEQGHGKRNPFNLDAFNYCKASYNVTARLLVQLLYVYLAIILANLIGKLGSYMQNLATIYCFF